MFWILAAYLIVLTGYSTFFLSRSGTETGFFISGRQLDTFTLSLTIAATTIGGSAVVVTWTLMRRYGVWGILPDIAGGAGLCLLGVWLARGIRRTESITLPGLLRSRLSPFLIQLLAIAIVSAQLAWLALSFRSLQIIAGLNLWKLTVICGLTWVYSFIGGQWSVSRTDILQFTILTGGFIVMIFNGTAREIPLMGTLPLPVFYLVGLMFFSHLIGPDVFAKIFSAKNEKTAKNGTIAAGILKILFSLVLLMAFSTGIRIEKLNLILFLAVVSAILSSVDSIFISATAILERDILKLNHHRFTPHLIGVILFILSMAFAVSGLGIVKILASGYTIFLIFLFFPTLSVLLNRQIRPEIVWTPVFAFFVAWVWMGHIPAFFIAFGIGGFIFAFEKHYREKKDSP